MPDLITKITRSISILRPFAGLLILALAPLSANPNASLSLLQAVKNQDAPALSPTAALDMLSLLYYGADGRTATQLGALFGGASQEEAAEAAAQAQRKLPGYQRIGSLWFSERVAVTPDFLKAVDSQWQFYTSSAPLRTDAAKAASRVNFYYEQQTNGFIKDVISANQLDDQPDMLAVIVSAFISSWAKPFDPAKTATETFYRSSSEKFPVSMMRRIGNAPYFADDKFQIVSLEVEAKDFDFLVLLPKDARQLDAALGALNADYLSKAHGKLKKTDLKLSLPRVSFRSETNWGDVFAKSKLDAPFTAGKADFSRINANQPQPLYISHLIEEADIAWDEYGFQSPTKPAPKPESVKADAAADFKANHPFVFIVYNKKEKDAAFAGIIQSQAQMAAK